MKKIYRIPIALLFLFLTLHAQSPKQGGKPGFTPPFIGGKVVEAGTGIPMEFANIVLYNSADSSQVNGTVSNKNGVFELERVRKGNYYVKISFIGFDEKTINKITIEKPGKFDIGEVELTPHTYGTDDVVVNGQRSPISYEIDRKVIDVGSQLTAASGSAIDILENVPSVTVDIEGNVSLRGSSNFTVLIDGRPTIIDASDVLEQIPASTIQNIEIITNPSAKFDPEGVAGIINIIMKKTDQAGVSGIAELNGGLNDQYGVEGIFDYNKDDLHVNATANYNRRIFGIEQSESNWTERNGLVSYYSSNGNGDRGRDGGRLGASLSYDFGLGNILTMGGRYSDRTGIRNSNLNYSEWSSSNPDKQFFASTSEREHGGADWEFFSNYIHKFNDNGHELIADFSYESENNNEFTINELSQAGAIVQGQKTTESGPEEQIQIKLDYTLPLNAASKFEAGYQTELQPSRETTQLFYYDAAASDYVEQLAFGNEVKYDKTTHAIYSLYSNEIGNLGFQFGARTEYTGRQIDVTRENNSFKIDRWDFFPSAHFSYKIADGHQLMTSYTRRINRPHGWELEPFQTWIDAFNVRVGNPALSPEYIDSYELGYQTYIGNSVVSIEGYYRIVNNKIERISSVYDDGVKLGSVANVGKDYSLGTELFINFDPITNWNMNLIGNLYDYRITGELDGTDFSKSSFNWSVRFNNIIKLSSRTQFQINTIYNSPSVSSQGRRENFLFANIAVKHEIFENLLTATLQIRDILGSAKREFTLETPTLYSYSYGTRESADIMLNLRFTFNNYKKERGPSDGDGGGMDGDEF